MRVALNDLATIRLEVLLCSVVALNLRGEISGRIEKVEVETFEVAHKIIIKDPEKLRPRTRETADHSMPYIVAFTLKNGAPTPTSYDDIYLKDREILRIIDVSSYKVTSRFNEMYPENLPVKIRVTTDKGAF